MGVGVPVAYSGYMKAGGPAAYMHAHGAGVWEEGVQLLTVGR